MMKKSIIIVFVFISLMTTSQEVVKTCKVSMKCTLQEKPSPGTGIVKLKKGEKVDVLAVDGDYYKVRYNNEVGYLNNLFIYDDELVKIFEKQEEDKRLEEEKRKQARIEQQKIKDEEYKQKLIEEYGELKGMCIFRHKVIVGMTKNMVRLSLGSPDDVNRTTTTYGTHEQWVYEGENFDNTYLYFEGDLLKTIQD